MRYGEAQATLDEAFINPGKEREVVLKVEGRVIGVINRSEGIYYTHKAIFRKFEGLSLSLRVLEVLELYKIEKVCFSTENGHRLLVQVEEFYVHGKEYVERWNREKQLILSLERFTEI